MQETCILPGPGRPRVRAQPGLASSPSSRETFSKSFAELLSLGASNWPIRDSTWARGANPSTD